VSRAQRLLHEPLVHVLVVGALLFVLHRAVAPPSASQEIVVPADALAGMREEFRRRTGRMPSATDEQAMLEKWVDDEVLVREALAMGLDRGDTIVRRRLVQKMEYLLENTETVPAPTDAELETFVQAHAARYASAARISFAHVFISAQRAGAAATVEATALKRKLDEGVDPAPLGDPFLRGRELRLHSQAELAAIFGPAFAAEVMQLDEGSWSAPIRSTFGVHLVRVSEKRPGTEPPLGAVRAQADRDWRDARRRMLDRDARERLRARYRVSVERPGP
jgi:peptidyl-prolyl cis-trans isomerase C